VGLLVSLVPGYDVRQAPEGALTIAWVHRRVDDWVARPWFEDYDLVVASSLRSADLIREATGRRAPVLPLAADSETFKPGRPSDLFLADYAFPGNYWGVERRLTSLLDVDPGEKFILVGRHWDRDARMRPYWRGHLPQQLLAELYRSVKLVLDESIAPSDQAPLSGRVFEALASGTLVISDNVEGSREVFAGQLPTYRDGAELRKQLDRFLGDDEGRSVLADRLCRAVVEHHTYSRRAQRLSELALDAVNRPRIAIKAAASSSAVNRWGGFQEARSLARALVAHGFSSEVHRRHQWDDLALQDADVVLHLRGPERYSPRPAQVNVLWIVSNAAHVSARECRRYDLVFCASRRRTQSLGDEGVRAVFLPLAADARRFAGALPDADLGVDALFVGDCREALCPPVEWAVGRGLPLTVVGRGWEGLLPDTMLAATEIPDRDLGRWYASARVVLVDHGSEGAHDEPLSGQVFDVLASGGVVVSGPNPDIEAVLPGLVPSFASADELAGVVEMIGDGGTRTALVERGRGLVLVGHTMEARAATIAGLVWPLLQGRPSDCEGRVFGGGPSAECPGAGEQGRDGQPTPAARDGR